MCPVVKKLRCIICQEWLFGQTELSLHYKTHNQNKCTKCGELFTRRSDLTKHVLNHGPPSLQCKHCDEKFYKEHHLKNHLKDTHEFKCQECGEMFTSKVALHHHLSCFCHLCGQMFLNKSNRTKHSKKKKNNCVKCGMVFCSADKFFEHLHSSAYRYNVCGQQFSIPNTSKVAL